MIITGFQLRTSRKILNLTLKHLHELTNVSKVTLARLEHNIENLEDIKCSAQDAESIHNYFISKKLLFPNKHSIFLDIDTINNSAEKSLTRFQFLVARTICNMSQLSLSEKVDVHYNTIYRLEKSKNNQSLDINEKKICNIINFFKSKGISFPDDKSVFLYPKVTKF